MGESVIKGVTLKIPCYLKKSLNGKRRSIAGEKGNLINSQPFLSICGGPGTVVSAYYMPTLTNRFNSSIRRFFYNPLFLCRNRSSERLNRIVQGHTVKGHCWELLNARLSDSTTGNFQLPHCTAPLAPINIVRTLEVPRSELDLVKERVTVDVLNNKSLMEPALVIQRKLMRFCQFYFKLNLSENTVSSDKL